MRRLISFGLVLVGLFLWTGTSVAQSQSQSKSQSSEAAPEWSMKATVIEACSCPMFCQCYFNTEPAAHGGGHAGHGEGEHFCKFNNAYKVDVGHYGTTKLDGAKFWLAGDLGEGWSDGEMDWSVLTFDPAVTKEQREGIQAILPHLFPVRWKSFTVAEKDKPIEWVPGKDRAHAKLDGGKAAEVSLKRFPGMTDEPIVIHNLRYFGAPRNEGFIMMPNEVNALRQAPEGREPYEFENTNGFMLTIDINSDDVKAREQAG